MINCLCQNSITINAANSAGGNHMAIAETAEKFAGAIEREIPRISNPHAEYEATRPQISLTCRSVHTSTSQREADIRFIERHNQNPGP